MPLPRRTRRVAAFATAALLVGTAAAAAAGSPARRPTLAMASPRIAVSGDHRVGEFAVAVDPRDARHLVAAGYDFDSSQGPAFCSAFVSRDSGRHWRTIELVPGEHGGWGGDPWVTIAPDGVVHLTCLTVSIVGGSTMYRFTSRDGGLTWSRAAVLNGLVDKEAVYADRGGVLFACGSHAVSGGSSLAVVRSTDGGVHWGKPTFFQGLKNCNGMVAGPRGELYLNWLAVRDQKRVVGTLTSLDGGTTWRKPTTVAEHPYPSDYTDPQTAAEGSETYTRPTHTWPSLAVSQRTGSLFFATSRDDLATGTSGVKLRVSHDRGRSWSLIRLPVIPSALADVTFSRPTLAVDAGGRLALQVMANGGPGFAERETWLLVSADDGVTWSIPARVAATDVQHSRLDPRAHAPNTNALPAEATYTLQHPDYPDTTFVMSASLLANSGQLDWGGDYWGLVATPDGFVAMWEDFAEGGGNRLYARLVRVS